MNAKIQNMIDLFQKGQNLTDEERQTVIKVLKDVDKEFEITSFKLDRTEKVKRTTEILLEETIEELEQKRKAVEEQAKIIQAENERKTQELEEARELQLAMLPKSIPKLKDYELEVYMKTATEVGGDYYDFSLKHNGSINIAVGDATGHGMKAGTMVTMIKSLFTANSRTEEMTEFFSSTNEAIKNSNLKRMMIAFAMVNIYGKSLKVLNAGMPPVYYYKNSGGEIIELGGHNFPLGAMHKVKYKADEIEISHGDVVLMMSDGFPELHNEKDELYGYERFINIFKKHGTKSAEAIISTLKKEGIDWSNNKEPDDDVTFVVIKVK